MGINLKKYYKEILLILGVILYHSHIPFDSSYERLDIFLLYDYPGEGRYIANIMWESGMYLIALFFVFLLWYETRKGIYFVFFIWWVFNVLGYFLRYGQSVSLIGLPLLIILWFVYGKKRKI